MIICTYIGRLCHQKGLNLQTSKNCSCAKKAFVDYNPWENSYDKETNDIKESCSDLWRRMFIWWDGKVNPCDVDYKSNLLIGSIEEKNLTKSWNSDEYDKLRSDHLKSKRQSIKPCKSCVLI